MPAEKTERNAEIIRQYSRGMTQRQIAELHGINRQAVQQIIARHRAHLDPVDKSEAITAAAELLDELIAEAMQVVQSDPAPMVAGKDGTHVIDPESGTYVRDHTGRLAAMREVRGLLERKSKLLGLDSPVRTELAGELTYKIEGIDPEDIG